MELAQIVKQLKLDLENLEIVYDGTVERRDRIQKNIERLDGEKRKEQIGLYYALSKQISEMGRALTWIKNSIEVMEPDQEVAK